MSDSFKERSTKEWNILDVKSWLTSLDLEEEGKLFEAAEISGKSLYEIDRVAIAEIGVKSVGKQLELMKIIKDLMSKSEKPLNTVDHGNVDPGSKWKLKITNEDKKEWTPEKRSLYNTKTAMIVKEAKKIWSGNQKIHFKANQKNLLKLEEFVDKMKDTCSIEDIGFGRAAIRHHVLQWAQEKNRRLTDGYDFEKEHKPAKRAKRYIPSVWLSTTSESNDTDHDTDDLTEDTHSDQLKDISNLSSKVAITTAFSVSSLQDLSLKKHLIPLAKLLGVKHRAKGKYELLLPLARALFEQKYLEPVSDEINYVHLQRIHFKVVQPLNLLLTTDSSPVPSALSDDSNDKDEFDD